MGLGVSELTGAPSGALGRVESWPRQERVEIEHHMTEGLDGIFDEMPQVAHDSSTPMPGNTHPSNFRRSGRW